MRYATYDETTIATAEVKLAGERGRRRELRLRRMALAKEPNPIDQHVGSRVRLRRVMLGLSQEKLGNALGVTFQQVQKYEKGANRIGASRLQAISKLLDAPPSYFFDGAPAALVGASPGFEEGARPFVPDMVTTAEGLQLNRSFAKIRDPKVRRRIVDLVFQVAESEAQWQSDQRESTP
ncbi:MAG: transcriptional regulator, family [Hyphomicrobiales bacterium]|nr:transcriptional regulator, family [Hyphomicrobiales bacterium]